MLSRLLPYRLQARLNNWRHDTACRPVLETAPIVPAQDGLVIFSMMGTAVLLPYLVAVKSFWGHLRQGRVVILSDGTLTTEDREVLAWHCGSPEIIDIANVEHSGFPAGGAWERFLSILDRRGDNYVIQLDSDTVTLGHPSVVADAIASNHSFTLLGGPEWDIGAQTCTAFTPPPARTAFDERHIQSRMERSLASITDADRLRYIRGCAGFAGFSRGGNGRELARFFAEQMTGLLGREAMAEWGSEQVTSSFVVANDPDPVLLPYRQYGNYWAEAWDADCRFMHFVGAHRHDGTAYRDATRAALALMDR